MQDIFDHMFKFMERALSARKLREIETENARSDRVALSGGTPAMRIDSLYPPEVGRSAHHRYLLQALNLYNSEIQKLSSW